MKEFFKAFIIGQKYFLIVISILTIIIILWTWSFDWIPEVYQILTEDLDKFRKLLIVYLIFSSYLSYMIKLDSEDSCF